MQLNEGEDPAEASRPRKRALWRWLILLAVTIAAIYTYWQAIDAWEGMVRTWSDLTQLFWLIVPDGQQ